MNNYRRLVRVFLKDIAYDPPKDKGRKVQILVLTIFAAVFIMIPIAVGSGLFTYLMTGSLVRAGHTAFGIQVMYHLISIFTMVFGINVIFNELYFSTDIDRLLPLPIRGREIAAAKFSAAYKMENVMQFILILSCTIGFGLSSDMPLWRWPIAILLGLTLSMIPMMYCAILGILLMAFTRVVKSRDTVRKISVIFMLVVFALMALALTTLKKVDVDSWIVNAASQDIPFVRVMNVVFFENALLVEFMNDGNVLSLLIYAVLHIAILAVFLLVADRFYINSVSRLGEGTHRSKHSAVHMDWALQKRDAFRSYIAKEWKILRRTPVFFTNCILITWIWPVFVVIAGVMTGMDMTPGAVRDRIGDGETGFALGAMIAAFAAPFIMGAMNSLGSNAFSREGKHYEVLQFLPVPIRTQWNAKAAIGVMVTFLGTAPFFLFFGIYAGVPVLQILLYILITAAASVAVTYMGMLLDSVNPKLLWEDALSALRENYNTFFCMAIAIGIAALIGGACVALHLLLDAPVTLLGCGVLVLTVLFDIFIYHRSMTRGIENVLHVGSE
ncbi:MAG: hypothetical protein IJM25_02030 [Eubacterium sp.]|nr:hypothetical protein [Eubacterium sp.]